MRFVTEAERPGQLPLAVSALSQQTWVEDYRLPPPLALPFGTARSGWPALPPAAESVVIVLAPVGPGAITMSRSFPVVLGCLWITTPVAPDCPGAGKPWAKAGLLASRPNTQKKLIFVMIFPGRDVSG